jgi:AAA domain (dynein-related subfamily)
MNIKQLKEFLPYAFKVNASVMIHGLHGIGKSQVVKQFAEENGMQFIDRRLSQIESGDLLGLPDVSGEVTRYKLPNWLPTDPKSKGILFLDELNRARRDVLQGVFQLVLDRQLGDYTLPKGWVVVSAVNPNTDDYDVTNVFDAALMDRFLHVKLVPTSEEFFSYGRSLKDVSTSFMDYLQLNEDKLENNKLNTFTIERTPSRRSNIMAAKLLNLDMPEHLVVEGVGGLIGTINSLAYQTWKKESDVAPFSGEELTKKYSKIEDKVKKYTDPVSGRHDVIQASLNNLLDYLPTAYKKMKPEHFDNARKFLTDIPKDLSQGFLNNLLSSSSKDPSYMVDCVVKEFVENEATDFILEEKHKQFIAEEEKLNSEAK